MKNNFKKLFKRKLKRGKCGKKVKYFFDKTTGKLVISGNGGMHYFDEKDSSFYNNSHIMSIVIKNGVTIIGQHVFENCKYLTSVTIPDSVTSIGSSAFAGCTSLTSITIGNGVTSIGSCAFDNTAYYSNPKNWKNGVLYIGNYLINVATNISDSYKVKDGTKLIADKAFYNGTGLTSVTIPDSATSIGDSAFRGCTGLTSITIPDSVTSIGNYAFQGCTGLTSVTIPDSVTSIGDLAFYGCTGLTKIEVSSSNNNYCSDERGVLFNKDKTTLIQYPAGNTSDSYIIPSTVKTIGYYAFSNVSNLTSITIPDSVTSMGFGVFEKCTGLTSITIPNSITSISHGAFYNCTGLTSITIPDSVIFISNDAFEGCTGLTNFKISGKMVHMFEQLLGAGHQLIFNGPECDTIDTCVIPEGYQAIAEKAFSGYKNLRSVTIPESVVYIGNGAFEDCLNLKKIVIPDSVKYVGFDCFTGCDGLEEVSVPCSAKYGLRLFRSLHDGENIICFNSYYCSGLKKVILTKGTGYMNSFDIVDHVSIIDLRYEGTVIHDIPYYTAPWYNNKTDKVEVIIKDGVETIAPGAFCNGIALKKITIPASVKAIGEKAFLGCDNLSLIYFKGSKKQWDDINGNYKCVNWAEMMDNNSRSNQMKAEMHYIHIENINHLKDVEIIYEN